MHRTLHHRILPRYGGGSLCGRRVEVWDCIGAGRPGSHDPRQPLRQIMACPVIRCGLQVYMALAGTGGPLPDRRPMSEGLPRIRRSERGSPVLRCRLRGHKAQACTGAGCHTGQPLRKTTRWPLPHRETHATDQRTGNGLDRSGLGDSCRIIQSSAMIVLPHGGLPPYNYFCRLW
jgi:hypothetical protein